MESSKIGELRTRAYRIGSVGSPREDKHERRKIAATFDGGTRRDPVTRRQRPGADRDGEQLDVERRDARYTSVE
ncbi:hypothetical protein NKF26_12135 [Haladaptatus sp. AB618]|uniref:hypothetical protein n=1 Tax=Haladaptatus sp. AB618 TaxID=2934173 RepID=UPI00209BDEBD|nr:hypothetical protein [Haladaptatus sp. AB618]MCO8254552.1 hypothetical protein [Haladaptatus sp. AB618]